MTASIAELIAGPDRRQFLAGSAAAAILSLSACESASMSDYTSAAARLRTMPSGADDVLGFVRLATLAPNGHNTQPWRFALRPTGVTIRPEFSRRTPVVDSDDHHLFVGLGCAAETFAIAAAANGRPATIAFDPSGDGKIDIDLYRDDPRPNELYQAIPARQSTRSLYDARALPAESLALMEVAARMDGVALKIISDTVDREKVLELLVQANSRQMDDPAFVSELAHWLRFNPTQAMASGDGLFSEISGNPQMPAWLGEQLFRLTFRKNGENTKYATQLRSSSGVAIFIGDKSDPEHWIKVGRSFQRFALQATALGIRHAHLNQLVEVPAVRADFARWLGVGAARPDLVVRFGMAPPMPMSLRRPVGLVITEV